MAGRTSRGGKATPRRTRAAPAAGARTRKSASARPRKDPKGGLTAAGRAHFARTEGAHLKPGVQGKADTPEKMKRKGSFLRRFFGRAKLPPLQDAHGEPTRLALSAHAWGEPVPSTPAQARKLAAKGERLLERASQARAKPARSTRATGGRATGGRATGNKATGRKARRAPASAGRRSRSSRTGTSRPRTSGRQASRKAPGRGPASSGR
jgi:hypothetical protein